MVYRKAWTQPAQGSQGFARTMKAYGRKVDLKTSDINAANTVGLFMLPPNFCVLGWYGPAVPALGAALVFNIGVPGAPAGFLSASTIGAAGGALPAIASTGPFFRTYADTEVQLTVTTPTAAPVAGILEIYIFGFIF